MSNDTPPITFATLLPPDLELAVDELLHREAVNNLADFRDDTRERVRNLPDDQVPSLNELFEMMHALHMRIAALSTLAVLKRLDQLPVDMRSLALRAAYADYCGGQYQVGALLRMMRLLARRMEES